MTKQEQDKELLAFEEALDKYLKTLILIEYSTESDFKAGWNAAMEHRSNEARGE